MARPTDAREPITLRSCPAHPSAQVFKLNPAFKLNTIFVGLQSPLRVIFSPISPKVLGPRYMTDNPYGNQPHQQYC